MAIDVEVLTAVLVQRLQGVDPNLTLRAQAAPTITALHAILGLSTLEGTTAKSSSIFHARRLAGYRSPTAGTKFAPPFIAYREGPIVRRDRTTEVPTYRLFIYDEPGQGYGRINKLIPLVSRALTEPPLQVAVGALIGNVEVTAVSGSTSDPTLVLLTRYLTIAMDTTWL